MSQNLQSLLFTHVGQGTAPYNTAAGGLSLESSSTSPMAEFQYSSFASSRKSRPVLTSIFPAPNLSYDVDLKTAKTPLPASAKTPGSSSSRYSMGSAMSVCDKDPIDVMLSSPLSSSLVADLSINLHIAHTPHVPTPRRALFPVQSRRSSTITNLTSSSSSSSTSQDAACRPKLAKFASFTGPTTTVAPSSVNTPLSPLAWSHPMQRSHSIRIDEEDDDQLDVFNKENLRGDATPPDEPVQMMRKLPLALGRRPTSRHESSSRGISKSTATKQQQHRNQNSTIHPLFKTPRPSLARISKARRTHSMFESPKAFLKQEITQDKAVMIPIPQQSPSIIDNESQSILSSETCQIQSHTVGQDPFRRIKRETLCDLLDGKHSHSYDRLILIDCRFEYEYEGGHIDGAININSKVQLEEQLLAPLLTKTEEEQENGQKEGQSCPEEKLLVVFHCEYSAHRGPRMAMHLRNRDRQINMKRYPRLFYPDIAILEGGYAHFFEENYERCVPQCYIEMNDSSHQRTCERELHRFKINMRQLGRRRSIVRGSPENSRRYNNNHHHDASMTPTGPARRITSMNY